MEARDYTGTVWYLRRGGYSEANATALVDKINDANFTDISQDDQVVVRRVGIHPWTFTVAFKHAHLTADGVPVIEGAWFWNNNLDLVQITKVNDFGEKNENTGEVAWWHRMTVWELDASHQAHRHRENDMADGSRLARRNPFSFEAAEDAARGAGLI